MILSQRFRKILNVDDLISGGCTKSEAQVIKNTAIRSFQGWFQLHKWHSNVGSLEDQDLNYGLSEDNLDTTYAKNELGVMTHECKILGLGVDLIKCKQVGRKY